MWNRDIFLQLSAHRGLHDPAQHIIENTQPAFEAAIAHGVGIECDLQCTQDNVPIVFHDFTLDRLVGGRGPVRDQTFGDIQLLSYVGTSERIMSFAALLNCVGGRVPLLIEMKSDWTPPNRAWLKNICDLATAYNAPIALMSFDPALLRIVKQLAPGIPRGLVSGVYRHKDRGDWWPDTINRDRARDLTNMCDIDTVEPEFIAYHVADLDTRPVHHARHKLGLPVITWTVRTADDWKLSRQFADAAIFEGELPSGV